MVNPLMSSLYFYPRSPCGERPYVFFGKNKNAAISIHALLAESDYDNTIFDELVLPISIHALLAESDNGIQSGAQQATAISIHALLAESD